MRLVFTQDNQIRGLIDAAQHGMDVGMRENTQTRELLSELPGDARRDVVLSQHLGHHLGALPHTLPHLYK